MVGRHSRMRAGLVGSILRTRGVRAEERGVREKAAEMLEYVGPGPAQFDQLASNLSYGDQRGWRSPARSRPEPTPAAARRAHRRHEPARDRGSHRASCASSVTTCGLRILLIEHDMRVVMGVCERIRCWTTARRSPRARPRRSAPTRGVIEAYLGKRLEAACLRLDAFDASYGAIEALPACRSRSARTRSSRSSAPTARASRTTLRSISGLLPPSGGDDPLRRRGHHAAPARRRSSAAGIAHVPEGRRIFPRMTVRENLDARRLRRARPRTSREDSTGSTGSSRASHERSAPDRRAPCRAASSRCSRSAARSWRGPKLLMLDEPSLGLAPDPRASGSSRRSRRSTARASRCCSSSRTPTRTRWSLGAATCSRPAGRAGRRLAEPARQPRGPEGVPGRMMVSGPHRLEGALPSVHLAPVGGDRLLADRAQGLRRAHRADLGPAALGRRAPHRPPPAGPSGLALEAGGLAARRSH